MPARLIPTRVRFLVTAFSCLLLLLSAVAAPAAQSAAPPRLVVVVVIDQFRGDYLARFQTEFSPDGFGRLLREGANFTSCYFPYAGTETGPGHATLATGTTPNRHGIAGNGWYDFVKGKEVEAVEDDAYPQVGSQNPKGVSPLNLLGTTLAGELRLAAQGEAKVFGVALKDRAAVFSTGAGATGAYWYDTGSGTMVTSRYYRDELPAWVVAFNEEKGAASYYGKAWKSGDRVFNTMITESGQPDRAYYSQFRFTPYGNQIALDFARELVRQENLGADKVTDFLFVGFSSNDYVGHRWGPNSDEVTDVTRQTDRQMAELLSFLDETVGAGKYWLALSGDHGVAPTVAQSRERGIDAKSVDREAVRRSLQQAFDERWGEDEWFVPDAEMIFNRETLRKHDVSLAEAQHLAGSVLSKVDGILGTVGGEETTLDERTTRAVHLSTYPGRSPDVHVVMEPFALWGWEGGGTGHGTPHSYDTHVALLFFGPAFRPGTYHQQVATIDLTPTLAAALGINPPALATGKVLVQALRRSRRRGGPPPN
jgi:arylsulfatase A-like enzyme